MSSASQFIIVVGIDFSELAARALDQALELATLHEGAEVHVLYVQPEIWAGARPGGALQGALDADTGVHQVQQNATEHVARMSASLDKKRLRRVVAHFRQGSPAENIAQLAADLDADMVIVGSHGHRGLERFFLGSIAERVSRLARCPVLIVRPKDHATTGHVPEIEPMCPDCLVRRRETGGAELGCARHSEHHLRPHRYSYASDGIYSTDTAAYASTPERGV
jgi:nucleotide-binding universal stress UspA family protein